MISDAKYFMLMGWAKFHASTRNADTMKEIIARRKGGNWGIAIADDYWALQWQRLRFREERAQRAIGNDKIRVYNFSEKGPLTMKIFGVSLPGWETDPEEVAKKADASRMQERRMKAKRACELLRDMPEPYDVREELNRLSYEDSCRDAMGY